MHRLGAPACPIGLKRLHGFRIFDGEIPPSNPPGILIRHGNKIPAIDRAQAGFHLTKKGSARGILETSPAATGSFLQPASDVIS
jgi:hypothetical protein